MPKPKHLYPDPVQYDKGKNKTTVSLSFSAPIELEGLINNAASARGMNRSQYLCWLVQQDLNKASLPSLSRKFPE